jgi:hypothetical protein
MFKFRSIPNTESLIRIYRETVEFRQKTHTAIINYLDDEKVVYFLNGYRYKHEVTWKQQLVKFSMATLFVTYQLRVALRCLSKENGVLSTKGLGRTNRTHSLAPCIPGPHSMRLLPMGICERPSIPHSDATVPSRANFTGHRQRRWVTVDTYTGRIRILRWRLQSNQWSTYGTSLDKLYEYKLFHGCICNRFWKYEDTTFLSLRSFIIVPCNIPLARLPQSYKIASQVAYLEPWLW